MKKYEFYVRYDNEEIDYMRVDEERATLIIEELTRDNHVVDYTMKEVRS